MSRRRRILLIDDDVLVRETVKLALAAQDYDVLTLPDSNGAQALVRSLKPDLIILDLYFPASNGLDLCRQLKGDVMTKDIPVMILTGSNETIDVMSGIEAGAFEYVSKPVDGEVLFSKIKQRLKATYG